MENPDKTEKVIRFGCGFTFGIVVTFISANLWLVVEGFWSIAAALVAGLFCGYMALREGDHFWTNLKKYWWW
jgi:hypothetical protein